MKKILFVFLSAILVFSLVMPPEQAKAAVVSKVAQKAVFKVVKEVAKDKAIEQSFSMVMNYKYVPKEEREKIKKPDQGFTMVCLPENRKNDICEKPMQVKSSYTASDKKAIASKVESVLDSKTGNKGFLKIVNWFIPVWIVGSAYTITDLLVDGDISSFFGDLGYEALVSLGFIKPLGNEVGKTGISIPPTSPALEVDSPDKGKNIIGTPIYLGSDGIAPKLPTGVMSADHPGNNYSVNYGSSRFGVSKHFFVFKSDRPYFYPTDATRNIFQNAYLMFVFEFEGNQAQNYPAKRVEKMTVYSTNSLYAGNTSHIFTVDTIPLTEPLYLNRTHSMGLRTDEFNHYMNLIDRNFWEKLTEGQVEPLPETKPKGVPVITPGTTTKVPSPSAVPARDTTTGKTVKPTKTSTPGDITWTDKDGNIVPEENIIIEDLITEETPNGTIIKNPDPSGIPEMQDGLTPNPDKAPPIDDSITEEDLEKLSCSRLKKPDFKPLSNAITTSFPFSIPWDLARMFNSAFSGIGNERPAFKYSFEFNGQKKEWNIEFPEYFDSWTSFTRPLLVIIFDAGLIFAIYRFTKGGD